MVVVAVVLAVLLAYMVQIPQKALAQIVSQEMSKIFKQPVRIGSIKGNFVTGVSLRDVQFFNPKEMAPGSMLEIARADVQYDLMSAFRHKGDVLAATHMVTLSGVRLKILRDRQDKWNVFALVPPPDPDAPPAPLTFKGMIRIRDMSIVYVDEKGWGPQPLSAPFSDVFSPMTGVADFADISSAQLRLQGILASNKSPFSLVGSLDVNTGQFRMMIAMKDFNFKRWQPYVLPFPELAFSGEKADVTMYLRSKYFPKPGVLPFFFDMTTSMKELGFVVPALSQPVQHVRGTFRVTNSVVLPEKLAEALGASTSLALEIMAYLRDEGILDPKNRVDATVDSAMRPLQPLVLPTKWQGYEKRLLAFLHSPDVRLVGEGLSGELAGAPWSGRGLLVLNKGVLDVHLQTAPFAMTAFSRLFPALSSWGFQGKAQGTIRVSGQMSNPVVSGEMRATQMGVKGVSLSHPSLSYRYHDRKLALQMASVQVYGTDATGHAHVVFASSGPTYQGQFALQDMPVGDTGFGLRFATGNAKVLGDFTGDSTHMYVHYQVPAATVLAWDQRLDRAEGTLRVTFSPLVYEVLSGTISLNGHPSVLPITAVLKPGKTWYLTASGRAWVYDVLGKHSVPIDLNIAIGADWQLPGKEMWDTVSGNLNVSAEKVRLLGTSYDNLYGRARVDRGRIQVSELVLSGDSQRLSFSGALYKSVVTDGVLNIKNVFMDAETLGGASVPPSLRPLRGLATGTVYFSQIATDNIPSWKTAQVLFDGMFSDVRIRTQPVSHVRVKGLWEYGKVVLSELRMTHQASDIQVRAVVHSGGTGSVEILPGTTVQLSDFQPVLYDKVGPLSGVVSMNGVVSGVLNKPDATLYVSVAGLKSYAFGLRDISGKLTVKEGVLSVEAGHIQEAQSEVGFSGHIRLWGDAVGPRYSWQMSFSDTSLGNLALVLDTLRKEMGLREIAGSQLERLQERVKQSNIQIDQATFAIQNPYVTPTGNRMVFQQDGTSAVQFYQDIQRRYHYSQSVPDLGLRRFLSGQLSGHVSIVSVDTGFPRIDASVRISDAGVGVLRTTLLDIQAKSHSEGLSFQVMATAGDMGGTPFEGIRFSGDIGLDSVLKVTRADVSSQGRENKNVVSGTLPLAAFWDPTQADAPVDMEFRWEGDDINVLTVFNPYLSRLSNKGRIVLGLKGTVSHPLLSTKEVVLKDAVVFLNSEMTPFLSGLRIDDKSVIQIKDNKLTVSPLIVHWTGDDTRPLHSGMPHHNLITASGTMGIENVSLSGFSRVDLNFDLSVAPTNLSVNLNKIYQGDIRAETIRFRGVYELPVSEAEKAAYLVRRGTEQERGPVLSGELYLSKGVLSLPTLGEKTPKPSILFNLSAYIRENVVIDGSLVGEGFLGNVTNKFHLELAESIQPLLVGGSFNALKIRNSVVLKSGYVLMLNRSFDVLPLDSQRVYYRDAQYRVHDNTVVFQTDFSSGKARLIPYFNVTALTVVEPKISQSLAVSSDTQVNPDDTKYSHVLVTLEGSAYDLKNFLFEKYISPRADISDAVEYRSAYRLVGGTNQSDTVAVLRLLAPQVFDVVHNTTDSRTTNTFWKDVGSSQINLIFNSALRPIETDLARNVGLNDIRFEYNVGQALFNNFSDKAVGINFVKSWFSNQLFVRVKTSVDLERKSQSEALQVSEVELTYFFERYFSVNVTNFKKDVGVYRNKYSVKYSNDF